MSEYDDAALRGAAARASAAAAESPSAEPEEVGTPAGWLASPLVHPPTFRAARLLGADEDEDESIGSDDESDLSLGAEPDAPATPAEAEPVDEPGAAQAPAETAVEDVVPDPVEDEDPIETLRRAGLGSG